MKKRGSARIIFALAALAVGVTAFGVARAASAVASISTLSALTGFETVTFSSDVWNIDASNVVLRLQDAADDLPASLSCTNASGGGASCRFGPVRVVVVRPSSPLIPGQRYQVIVNPSDATSTVDDYPLVTAIPTAAKVFIASLFEEETSAAASYQWRAFPASSAYDGSYQAEFLRNAAVTFPFSGSSVTWYTVTGPSQGMAQVIIDGASRGIVNNYSSSLHYKVARRFSVSSGSHRVTIRVLGQKGTSQATGTWVAFDAAAVNGVIAHPAVSFVWASIATSAASGGHFVRAGEPNMSVRFLFRGRTIDWVTLVGPSEGSANIFIDGVKKGTVNNHASTLRYGVTRRFSNLSDAVHTLTIVSGIGGFTSVDRFVVKLPDITIFRRLGTWVDLYDYGKAGLLDPSSAVPQMKSRGVRTIFIETARYNSSSAFDFQTAIGQWIEAAHANGLKIVGWYLPGYGTYLNTDVSRTVAIASYRSPGGQGFDGLGIDIETKATSSETHAAWMADIAAHLARTRSGVSPAFPVGAIVVPPLAMQLTSTWNGFPWSAVGKQANVVLPMSYWSYRTDCSTNPDHCPYQYSLGNINQSRSLTGGLPVHLIGGIANVVTAQGVKDYIQACHDAHAYGAGLYDYRTTTNSAFWTTLAGANTL